MILGSHNSWTYLVPKHFWQYFIRFTAKCQSKDIKEQYNAGVRCFDLRLNCSTGFNVTHGIVDYDITFTELLKDLNFLNKKGDCYVRVLNEVRTKDKLTSDEIGVFKNICNYIETYFTGVKFFCGRNLVNWNVDYEFKQKELTIEDDYASVKKPNSIYAIWPWLYTKVFKVKKETDKDVLLIDFV